jgi:hypothetical protein
VSADAFHVCYGVRREVDAADNETVELLEFRRHQWQVAAKQHGLQVWWGRTIDERRFFVLVGRMVGRYGWEGEAAGQLADAEVGAVMAETAQRLRAAGIESQPAWHFQFEPDR